MFNDLCIFAKKNGCRVLENEPMKKHTSFHIGGPAKLFIEPSDKESLLRVIKKAGKLAVPYAVIGNGSNLLAEDGGFDGAVIHLGERFGKIMLADEETIFCEAGANLMKVCNFALENSLTGLEFAYGIPGSAGGAVFMNAGAYGGEMKDVICKCEHITDKLHFGEYAPDALNLGYRYSVYSDNNFIITGIYLKLRKGDKSTIKSCMTELYGRRKEKQPLEYPSAGSTFKRPDGYFAGKLIQDCGLMGRRVGGAMVSEKHAGFVINYDNATCEDVLSLCNCIEKTVYEEYGVHLCKEVKLLSQVKKWN